MSGNSKLSFSRKEEGGCGMVVHAYNPSVQRLRQENPDFEASKTLSQNKRENNNPTTHKQEKQKT
jgi:hypothetical protein